MAAQARTRLGGGEGGMNSFIICNTTPSASITENEYNDEDKEVDEMWPHLLRHDILLYPVSGARTLQAPSMIGKPLP